jgi:hypothetical protein
MRTVFLTTFASTMLVPAALAQTMCLANDWCFAAKTSKTSAYIRLVNRTGNYVTVDVRHVPRNGGSTVETQEVYDCKGNRSGFSDVKPTKWTSVDPGTLVAAKLKLACLWSRP